MDRAASERPRPDAASEAECLREAAALGLPAPHPAPMPVAADGSPSQQRISRLVQALENDIIPRLVQAHRVPVDAPAGAPWAWPELRGFARLCFAPDEQPFRTVVLGLRQAGCPAERIFVELLGPAARELGLLWEDDLCDFTDVTVGVGRLQQLLRELSPAFGAEVDHPADGRRILLLPAPGEQHTLGASMVAEFFRRAGWDVVGGVGGSSLDPVQAVQNEWFDVLGLSAGHDARVDWLRDCITAVRRLSRNRGIGVMVGGPLFVVSPDLGTAIGSDVTVVQGEQGPPRAEALLASRAQRL